MRQPRGWLYYYRHSTERLMRRQDIVYRLMRRLELTHAAGGPRYSALLNRVAAIRFVLYYRPDDEKVAAMGYDPNVIGVRRG